MFEYENGDKEKTRETRSSHADSRGRCRSNADAPDGDEVSARREAVAEFGAAIRRRGYWNSDGGDLVPELLTALPSWQSSGLLLEIIQDGQNPIVLPGDVRDTIGREIIRLRRINDSHYRAIIDGEDVELGADGDCFFYSVWCALETSVSEDARRQIYRGNIPSNKNDAADFFRNEIADYSVTHDEEVGLYLSHARPTAAPVIKPDSGEDSATDASAENAARDFGWSEAVPFALKEVGRSLFHAGKSVSSALGWSLLVGQSVSKIFEWLPLNYWPFQFYLLYDTLINKREYLDAFLGLMSVIPYNTLSSDYFIFGMADSAREIYGPVLSGMDDLPSFFWPALAALALITNYALLERQNVELPQTRIGQMATACLQKLRHIPQIYGLLETIHSVTPNLELDEDGNVKLTTREISANRRTRRVRKTAFLSGRATPSAPPASRSDDGPIDGRPEMRSSGAHSPEFAGPPRGNIGEASAIGRNSSVVAASAPLPRATTGLTANSSAEPLALAALDAIFRVADHNTQISSSERPDTSLPAAESCPASHPSESVTSDAPEAHAFITLPITVVTAAGAHGAITRSRLVIGTVIIFSITVIAAYLVQFGLTCCGKTTDPDPDVDFLFADAPPLSQEYRDENADLNTGKRKWLYLKNKDLACIEYFIEHQFDHRFFEDALGSINAPDDENDKSGNETAIYQKAVRQACADFGRSDATPLHQLSSEDQYGVELYGKIDGINLAGDCQSQNRDDLKSALIKIKTYETLIIRKLNGEYLYGKEGAVARLETLFGLSIRIPEYDIFEEKMDDYLATESGYGLPATRIHEPTVKNGANIAHSLWNNATQRYLSTKSRIPESVISKSRDTISQKIRKIKEEMYTLRGPRDKAAYEACKINIAEYRYAAIHLENLIKISSTFLIVLNNIKPLLHKLKSQFDTSDKFSRDALPFLARMLAVKAVMKMLGNQDLNSLSDVDYLNNYPLIVGSSPEFSAFISLAEAIFYNAAIGLDTENLHRFASNPIRLIAQFRQALDDSAPNNLNENLAAEGMQFAQNITSNDKLGSDFLYYQQFIDFKRHYHRPLTRTLAYLALAEYGLHPYLMLSEIPTQVVRMTFYMRGKLPPPPRISVGYGYLLFLTWVSDQTSEKLSYAKAGELIFCKLAAGNWIVISTLGGSCLAKPLTKEQINWNPALKDIILERNSPRKTYGPRFLDPLDALPRGSNYWWLDQTLVKMVIRPIFGNTTGIDENSFEKAYLTLHGNDRDFKNKNMLTIAIEATDDMLTTSMEQAKEGKYRKKWWQYLTTFINFSDIIYRATQDSDYQPSAGEIAMEVLSGAATLLAIGFPVGRLSLAASKVLRLSLLKNMKKGLRGNALFYAVLAETRSDLAFYPIYVMGISSYQALAFWDPIPLDDLLVSLYKSIRNFKFKFKVTKLKPNTKPSLETKTLNADIPVVKQSAPPKPAEAKGLLVSLSNNDVRYYEYSYSYEKETLSGTGNLSPVGGGSQPAAPPPVALDALNEDGAIELSSSRATTTIRTPFTYSRSGAGSSADAVSSTGVEGQHLTFDSIEQGIADDIEFHRHSRVPSGYDDEYGVDANTEVVLLRETTDGVTGIRIDLDNIDSIARLIITSGEMSSGTFLIGIDAEDGSLYAYRLGNMENDPVDPDADNGVIRNLFETHNSLATRSDMKISIPEIAQKNDLTWFCKKFTKTVIIYAENAGATGFTIPDRHFDPPANPSTSHSASSPSLDLLNYNAVSSETNIIQRTGNAYYLLSRKDNDHVTIVGNAQYRGDLDISALQTWAPSSEDRQLSETAQSDISAIENLLVDSGKEVSGLARDPSTDTIEVVSSVGKYFLSKGYNVKYRIFDIWPSNDPSKTTRHYAVVVEKNGRTYVVDALAGREFLSKGISDPIYTTDPLWRILYAEKFYDCAVLIRDVATFEPPWNIKHHAPPVRYLPTELSDPAWIVLNKPFWTSVHASQVTESINTNLEIDIGASRIRQGRLDSTSVIKNPIPPEERFEKWETIKATEGFVNALFGSPSSALEKLLKFLTENDVDAEIIMTKTYETFSDKNPVTNYAMQVNFKNEKTDVIVLKRTDSDDGFEVTSVLPLSSWRFTTRHKFTFVRVIKDPKMIADFLDAEGSARDIGQSAFFDERTSRYSLLHFDLTAMSALENALARIRAKMDKYSGPHLGNDLKTENAILEKHKNSKPGNDMDIRDQETRVQNIYEYQFLRDLRGRLEDLRGKIRGEFESEIIPKSIAGKRMIIKSKDFETRVLKDGATDHISVKKYDPSTKKYLKAPGFLVMNAADLVFRFGAVDFKSVVSAHLNTYKELYNSAIEYAAEGRTHKARKIILNARAGIESTERLMRYIDLGYVENFYVLVDSANFNAKKPEIYGLTLVLYRTETDTIFHLDTWVAHPFTYFADQQDFVDYSIRHGATWDLQQLEKYRTEDVDRFLIFDTAKKLQAQAGPQYFSIQVRTARAENIASAFGFKEVNDLEYYGLAASLESTTTTCQSLLLAIFQPPVPGTKLLPDSEGTAEETPFSVAPGKLNEQWRREGVSLDSETAGDRPDRFKGIYSVPVAGTSTSSGQMNYYIKEMGNVYEVRWDDNSHSWHVINPLDPGTFGNAPRISLDNKGHWVIQTGIPETGGAQVPKVAYAGNLIDLTRQQASEMRALVESAYKRAIIMIEDALNLFDLGPDYVDDVMDIFLGRHNDVAKEKFLEILKSILKFLKENDDFKSISYKAGYFDNKSILALTRAGSAIPNWDRTTSPPITISVDALAEVTLKKKFTKKEFENYVSYVLIHESYHAVTKGARDVKYVTIANEMVDISNLVLLTGPDLFGDNAQEIASSLGISFEDLVARRNSAYKDSFNNPDNIAYMIALLSKLHYREALYNKFIDDFDVWQTSHNSPLEFQIDGHLKGGQLRLKTRTAIASLNNGNIESLRKNGLLHRKLSTHIPIEFEALTPGARSPEAFDVQDPKFSDFIDTWKGSATTSQKNAVWYGTWGVDNLLSDDFSIIEIKGEKSKVSAVRINLSKIKNNRPVLISGGKLSGSTIAFAVSSEEADQYLYVFHAGYQPDDLAWQVSEQGVIGIYEAHQSFGGKSIENSGVPEGGTVVEGNSAPLDYRTLRKMLGNYERGFVAYSGRLPNAPSADIAADTLTQWVDYTQGDTASIPGNGYAYALLTKQGKTVDIKFCAGQYPAPQAGGGPKPKKTGP